jgi:hypothetical protein
VHACKSNFDAGTAMDAVRAIYDAEPDIAAIADGGECAPLAAGLREMGAYVEAAAFRNSTPRRLPRRASGYIRLDDCCAGCDPPEPRTERIEPSAPAGASDALQAAEDITEAGAGENIGEAECRGSPAAGLMERALGEAPKNPPGVE